MVRIFRTNWTKVVTRFTAVLVFHFIYSYSTDREGWVGLGGGKGRGESGRKWGMLSANWRIMSLYLSHIEIHCLWQTGLHLTVRYELAFCPIQSIIRPNFQYDCKEPLWVINRVQHLLFRVFIVNYKRLNNNKHSSHLTPLCRSIHAFKVCSIIYDFTIKFVHTENSSSFNQCY